MKALIILKDESRIIAKKVAASCKAGIITYRFTGSNGTEVSLESIEIKSLTYLMQ